MSNKSIQTADACFVLSKQFTGEIAAVLRAANQEIHESLMREAAMRNELESESARLNALEETIRNCPGAELGHNDDADEGEVGFYLEIDGCDPVKLVSNTLRGVLDSHITFMRDGAPE